MNYRKQAFSLILSLSLVVVLQAQTVADSLAVVSANWKTTLVEKGMVCREAEFPLLYGVPQHVVLLEITPGKHKFDVLMHSPKEITSVAASHSGAIAAINGSYFNVKEGTSVCYLLKDGMVVDTTKNGTLGTVTTGAIKVRRKKLSIIPWTRKDERTYRQKRGSLLASGPLMLLDGRTCDLSACNQNFVMTKHPRSAVAVTGDRKILFIVVDGRFKGQAEGVNIPELTHLIRILGGKDAINLDGGGSSTLWCASAPDNGVLNHPSDNKIFDHHGERKVANSLCVYK